MSSSRSIRLRREYLYKKSVELKNKKTYEQKQVLKKAIEGRKIYINFYKTSNIKTTLNIYFSVPTNIKTLFFFTFVK